MTSKSTVGPVPSPNGIGSTDEAEESGRDLVEVLADRQAGDIVLLDIRPVSGIADYFVIASAETERHLRALQEYSERLLLRRGTKPLHREGTPASGWILLDYGSLIVHLFDEDRRSFYRLDRLWDRAKPVLRIQ